MPARPRWTVSKVVQEIDLESGAPAADAPAGGSDPVIDPTALSNLLLAGSSRADMEAILTDTMSGGTATKFHRALEAILETGEGPDLEKLKEAVDVVCTTLKPHIADMIQREVCRQALHAAPLLCGEFGLTKVKPAKLQVTAAMSTLLRKLAALEDVYIIVNDHTKDATTLEDKRKKAATALTQAEDYLEELDFTDSGTAMFSVDFTIDWTDAEDKLLMAAVKKLCTDWKLPNNPDIIDWDVIVDAIDDRDDDDCKAQYCSKAAN